MAADERENGVRLTWLDLNFFVERTKSSRNTMPYAKEYPSNVATRRDIKKKNRGFLSQFSMRTKHRGEVSLSPGEIL